MCSFQECPQIIIISRTYRYSLTNSTQVPNVELVRDIANNDVINCYK